MPGALRGVRPDSSGSLEFVCFGAWVLGGLRLIPPNFGGLWVKGVQFALFVFISLGLGIRCWGLERLGAAGVFAAVASAGAVRA